MKIIVFAAAAIAAAIAAAQPAAAQPAQQAAAARPAAQAPLQMWRLGCGEFVINQYGAFFFDRIARNLGARVIIQHEPADIAKLPPFPQAAR